MPEGRLAALADHLAAAGIDPGHLAELQDELDAIQEPRGLFRRWAGAARKAAARQWRMVIAELRQSGEVMQILSRRARSDQPLSPEERDMVRSQLLDAFRAVPASMIAVGNAVQPMPGSSMLTPWILMRLGLLPSRWREAHLLGRLRREEERLRAAGHLAAAQQLSDLEHTLEAEADAREEMAQQAELLARWDANRNGVWDDTERAAYGAEVARLRGLAASHGARKRWYLHGGGQVFGPVRLSRLSGQQATTPLLVCFDGAGGWVELTAVLEAGAKGS